METLTKNKPPNEPERSQAHSEQATVNKYTLPLIEVYKTYIINKHLTHIKGEVTTMLFFILELNKPSDSNFSCLTDSILQIQTNF